jgi:hypothetical protein
MKKDLSSELELPLNACEKICTVLYFTHFFPLPNNPVSSLKKEEKRKKHRKFLILSTHLFLPSQAPTAQPTHFLSRQCRIITS